jgi:hypothetical protein
LCLFAKRQTVEKRMVDHLADNDSLFNGKNYIGPNKQKFDYTSGMIQSKQRYQYGYFELKFKMPADKGFWPAFWLQGGYPNEEIDWMELKTDKKNAIHVGRHSQKKEENILRKFIRKRPWGDWVFIKGNLSKDWHIISGEWAPGYLKYYLNGECIAYSKVPLQIEKKICINLAVPGNDGPFHPGPDTLLKRSGNFEIDYVRVWGKDKKDTTTSLSQTLENTLGGSKLRSKGKFLYGNKNIHKNEGITVALIPVGNNKYELQVTGKRIPDDAFYSITSEGSVPLISKNLKYGFTVIDLSEFKETALQLNIHYLKQIVKFPLRNTN